MRDMLATKPAVVKKGATIREAIDQMILNPVSRKIYVVDERGILLGTVTTETILRLIGYRVGVREMGASSFIKFLIDALKESVDEVMDKSNIVTEDTKLTKALEIMVESHLNDLPVVDGNGRLIGELVSLAIFTRGKDLFDQG